MRYRNRLQVEHELNAFLAPYVSIEGFYDGRYHAWSRFQYSAGLLLSLGEHFSGQFYFLRQNDNAPAPKSVNVLGTQLSFFF